MLALISKDLINREVVNLHKWFKKILTCASVLGRVRGNLSRPSFESIIFLRYINLCMQLYILMGIIIMTFSTLNYLWHHLRVHSKNSLARYTPKELTQLGGVEGRAAFSAYA